MVSTHGRAMVQGLQPPVAMRHKVTTKHRKISFFRLAAAASRRRVNLGQFLGSVASRKIVDLRPLQILKMIWTSTKSPGFWLCLVARCSSELKPICRRAPGLVRHHNLGVLKVVPDWSMLLLLHRSGFAGSFVCLNPFVFSIRQYRVFLTFCFLFVCVQGLCL